MIFDTTNTKFSFFLFILLFIEQGVFAQQNDSVKIDIVNLGSKVNSTYYDFAPVLSADGATLIFTSRRPCTEKDVKKHKASTDHIFQCEYDRWKKSWSEPILLPETINHVVKNNSAIALSNDGQHLLLYFDDVNGKGDIFESKLNGSSWSEPEKLPTPINSEGHESSASISPDGKTIYFVSDRPGGKGGRDIWYCTKNTNGSWNAAINAGDKINTDKDEEGVFIHPDGKTIYFSSKGHQSIGGYDIFKSIFQNNEWTNITNLGTPLNTTEDDVFFVMLANGKKGFYTSGKEGGIGEKDLYEVNFIPLNKEEKKKAPRLTLVRGTINDEKNNTPLEADIEIIDNEKNEVIFKIKSNSSTGKYLVSLPAGKNYGLHIVAKSYLFHSENFNIPDTASFIELNKPINLKKIEIGNKIILNNIFYDYNEATLRKESTAELDKLVKLMEANPDLKIELSSYTDAKGTDDYNLRLSQSRAQNVVNYLIINDIDASKLIAKGYGETRPIAPNDTEEGRQLNRRTEFKILQK